MFVIHGHYPWNKKRGWVAEFCEACQQVQACEWLDLYHYHHLYFIPFWRTLQSSSVQCPTCQTKITVEQEEYADVFLAKGKIAPELDTLLSNTNPFLHRIVTLHEKLLAPDAVELFPEHLMVSLYHGYRQDSIQQILDDLHNWPMLELARRQALQAVIEEVGHERYKLAQARKFLFEITKQISRKKYYWLALGSCVAAIAVLGLFYCMLAVFFPADFVWMLIIASFALAVAWIWFLVVRYRALYRSFIQNMLIPAAEARGIDLMSIGSLLSKIHTAKEKDVSDEVKQLAGYWKMYAELLTEHEMQQAAGPP